MTETPSEPRRAPSLLARVVQAALLGLGGAWVGHRLGKWGDNIEHKGGRIVGALIGGGGMAAMSFFITRPEHAQTDKAYTEESRPYVVHHLQHEGRLQAAPERVRA